MTPAIHKITQVELAYLILRQQGDRPLRLKHGPGWIGIEFVPENEWAFAALAPPGFESAAELVSAS